MSVATDKIVMGIDTSKIPSKAEAARRVALGAELLDLHYPGWPTAITVEGLDMASYKWCVLGKIKGDYDVACESMGLAPYDSYLHGFTCGDFIHAHVSVSADYIGETNALLHAEWTRVIRQRQRAARKQENK